MSAASLTERLRQRIADNGPMTVADFMSEALTNSADGYYMTRDPFGVGGDFTTAPEISQIFGEVLGLWAAITWQAMGAPASFNLVELGPGRGTLMADVLRAARAVPGFNDAAHIQLVEISPVLRAIQKETIEKTTPQVRLAWHDRFADVPPGPMILLANEFFDALPVRQFVCGKNGWSERLVDLTEGARDEESPFQFTLSMPMAVAPLVPADLNDAPVGAVFEVNTDARDIAHAIGERIMRFGGAAIIFDYGHYPSGLGETLQAVKGHSFIDLLATPGEVDLTAHVDFAAMSDAAGETGADIRGPVPQGAFLERLGMGARAEGLAAHATPEQADDIRTAYERLTGAEAMGSLFKVLVITKPGLVVPPWS